MKYFQPNYEKQDGIFNYLISQYPDNYSWFINLLAHPRSDTCELYTAIREDGYTRFLSERGKGDLYIHLNQFQVKITHFAIKYARSYCFTKKWDVYDYTLNKYKHIASTEITDDVCGQDIKCNSDSIKIVPIRKHQVINTLYFKAGIRSDGVTESEFKSFEIYGYLYDNYPLNECTSSKRSDIKLGISIFILLYH